MAGKGKEKRNVSNFTLILEEVEVEEARQAGAVHVGHQIWQRLGLDQILAEVGFGHKTCLLTQVMTLNRLIEPSSELAMSEWVARSALSDILKEDFHHLNEDRLYRNMDRLYGKRGPIKAGLSAKEKTLFSLKKSILLYDLTSTYFEGLCLSNPKSQARSLARFPAKRIALGRLRTAVKIYEAIGSLKERYPRVARYYQLAYDEQQCQLSCLEDLQRKQKAESLDGSYLLKSSRNDPIIWSDGSKLTSFCVCWPTTCWSVLSAPSWIRVSTLHGKLCAGSCPLTS